MSFKRLQRKLDAEDARLITQAIDALDLPNRGRTSLEIEDFLAAARRRPQASPFVVLRLVKARFVLRKVARYYKARNEQFLLIRRIEDGH